MLSGEFSSGLLSRWQGAYRYAPGSGVPCDVEVAFAMQLAHASLGRFNGTIDDREGGVPERAAVRGRVFLRSMRFEKRYPNQWGPSADPASAAPGAIEILGGVAPIPIRYVGRLAPDGGSVEGTWSIAVTTVVIDGQRMWIGGVSGFWRAERVELRPDVSPRA